MALQERSRSESGRAADYVAMLEAAGFRDARAVPIGAPRQDDSTIVALVRARLVERLEPNAAVASNLAGADHAREQEQASFTGDRRLFQIFASRPA